MELLGWEVLLRGDTGSAASSLRILFPFLTVLRELICKLNQGLKFPTENVKHFR